jgi:ribosomal protein S12 methylthiotransferase
LKIGIVTLGCDKNTVDNEYLAGLLSERGHQAIETGLSAETLAKAEDFDAVVITTCGFIEAARGQSIYEISRWAEAKRETGRPEKLIVAGCLTQRYATQVLASYPEIDGLAGVGEFEALADLIEEAQPDAPEVCLSLQEKPEVRVQRSLPRKRLGRRTHAYLKIADGCDHGCAFCSIPIMKGQNVSVAPEILVEEARGLLEGGARELNLIAQDLSLYGRDFGNGGPSLAELLKRLAGIDGDFWLRLLYLYPGGVTDELLELAASEPKICKYFDIPLQHLSQPVLRGMRRPWSEIKTEKMFEHIRSIVPKATLRTTFIVGFPGETDADFECLLEGVKRLRIDRVGAFIFSREEGTDAYSIPDQVPAEIAAERLDRLMQAQSGIAFDLNGRRVGNRERVLFEGRDREKGMALARSQAEAAEIDGLIYVKGAGPKRTGEFGEVEIVEADDYDLIAEAM